MLLRITTNRTGKKKPRKVTKVELDAEKAFHVMQDKWDKVPTFARVKNTSKLVIPLPDLSTPVGRTNTRHIPSVNPSQVDTVGLTSKATSKVYTGSKMKGVSQMHKSNGVPVFDDEQIKDIAKMRR